ncbi:MAG TPA: ATP-binding protein [Mucilaginibacter sp.]|jgi:signal transduction histidine kinase/CheY-like chemotaxis protein|nr:ATP-binding protein [Mucilaginibacter sp.]
MKRVTDKYHRLKEEDNHPNPLFDIKEVSKRTYQLGIAALLAGVGLSFYSSYQGLYASSIVIASFCFSVLMVMLLKYNGHIGNLTIFIISIVCGLLIAVTFVEGLQSEQYLYFFPILIAVPIIVDLKRTQYLESVTYISIIVVSFIICVLIGRNIHPFEEINAMQLRRLSFVNRMTAISSTIVFAMAYLFFEKKYINELVDQSNRVIEARTRFLATMGHELRTPLNGIIGVVNLLKQEKDPATQEEYFQVLKYCSDHMLHQVNNILDFNKIEAGKLDIYPVELNLQQLLKNVGMPFIALMQEKGVELKTEIDPRLDVMIMADDVRLIQIFNNLFSNALKFTDSGFVKLTALYKGKTAKGIEVDFCVEDTGLGIATSDQKKIFESFGQIYHEDTKKFGGTGLGLTIVLRLLKLMNGNLQLQSDEGKGSKFSFDLKFDYPRDVRELSKAENIEQENLEGIRLLLVEDNQLNMMVAKKILGGYKADVVAAYNGQEALNELQRGSAFDIILMDLEMPVMSGYEAIFEMKRLYPHIPVMAFTASLVDQTMLSDLIGSGFVDVILKPFQPQQLLSNVRKHLPKPTLQIQ